MTTGWPFTAGMIFLAVAGCGGKDPAAPTASFAGAYTVKTINGKPLPESFKSGPNFNQVLHAATYQVYAGGTFSVFSTKEHFGAPPNHFTVTGTCTGAYTTDGHTFEFSEQPIGSLCGAKYVGTWDGQNRITLEFPQHLVPTRMVMEK